MRRSPAFEQKVKNGLIILGVKYKVKWDRWGGESSHYSLSDNEEVEYGITTDEPVKIMTVMSIDRLAFWVSIISEIEEFYPDNSLRMVR